MFPTTFKTTPAFNEKNGSGKFSTPRKRKRSKQTQEERDEEFCYLSSTNPRMRFNNAKDPLYHVFDHLENRTVMQLMGDFVKDSFFEIKCCVSKVMK